MVRLKSVGYNSKDMQIRPRPHIRNTTQAPHTEALSIRLEDQSSPGQLLIFVLLSKFGLVRLASFPVRIPIFQSSPVDEHPKRSGKGRFTKGPVYPCGAWVCAGGRFTSGLVRARAGLP